MQSDLGSALFVIEYELVPKMVIRKFRKNESGASIIEYALVILVILLGSSVAMASLGNKLDTFYSNSTNQLPFKHDSRPLLKP